MIQGFANILMSIVVIFLKFSAKIFIQAATKLLAILAETLSNTLISLFAKLVFLIPILVVILTKLVHSIIQWCFCRNKSKNVAKQNDTSNRNIP